LQLTPDELSLFNYVTALADWLEPYHNYTRPSPAAVLAEAVKQNSTKSSTKGVQPNPQNGPTTNGHTKKEMEAPPVKDAPETVPKFFDGIIHLTGF
jgi:N-terminal acetyltransferase B complex non-catalytic subunit